MLKRLSSSLTPSGLEGQDRFVARWGALYLVLLTAAGFVLMRYLSASDNIEAWQQAMSLLALGTLAFFIVAVNKYLKQDATDEAERKHLRAIQQQLVNVTPTRLTIHHSESLRAYRYEIHKLFEGRSPDQTTVRDSLAEFRQAWRDQTRVVPGLALKLSYEAALILVFGAVVILPVSWWSGGEALSVGLPPIGAWLWTLATAFPGGEILVALGLAAVFSVGGVLFEHWFILALVLFAGAALIAWLDRKTETDLDVTLYPDRTWLVARAAMWVGLIWVAGAVPGLIHPALGGALAAGVAVIAVVYIGTEFVARILEAAGYDIPATTRSDPIGLRKATHRVRDAALRTAGRQGWIDYTPSSATGPLPTTPVAARVAEPSPSIAAYLVVRKVWALIGLLCLPLLAAYVGLAVGTGAIAAVALEVATAPWHIRLPALAILVVAALLVKANYPELTDELLEATRRASSSSLVRGFLFARGVPFLAVFVGFAVAWPLFGVEMAVAIAIVAGIFARLLTLGWQAMVYRFVDFGDRDSGVSEVVVEAFELEDADGRPIYVARVDGHELAHRDRDVLVDLVVSVAEDRFEDGETPATFAHYYFEEATENGRVDIDYVADEYRSDIKTRITATLRESDGELDVETLDSEMTEKYAEPAYRQALGWLRRQGNVDVRRGKYVLH